MHHIRVVLLAGLAAAGCAVFRPLPSPAPGVRCLREEPGFREPVEQGRDLADAESQHALRLAAFDSAEVALVDDPVVCGRASRALDPVRPGPALPGQERPTYSDVVVVRLGRAGYLVHAYWHTTRAGEFTCDRAIVSARFGDTQWLCG